MQVKFKQAKQFTVMAILIQNQTARRRQSDQTKTAKFLMTAFDFKRCPLTDAVGQGTFCADFIVLMTK